MLRLVLARHGQSEGDTRRVIEGSADLPLTATGRLQGRLLADRIARDYRLTAVFTSPLQRAQDIARDIAGRAGVPLLVDPRLSERTTGIMAGVSWDEAAVRWPRPERGHMLFERFPGGESDIDQYARVAEFAMNLFDVLGQPFPGVWGRRTQRFEGECESTRDLAPWENELKAAVQRHRRRATHEGITLVLVGHGGTVSSWSSRMTAGSPCA